MLPKKVSSYLITVGILLVIFSFPALGVLSSQFAVNSTGAKIITILFLDLAPILGYWLIVFGIINFTKLNLFYKIIISFALEPGIKIIIMFFGGGLFLLTEGILAILAAFVIMTVLTNKERLQQVPETSISPNISQIQDQKKLNTRTIFLLSAGASLIIFIIIFVIGTIFWVIPSSNEFFGFGGGIATFILLFIAGIAFLISFITVTTFLKNKGIKNNRSLLISKIISVVIIVLAILFISRSFFFNYKNIPLIKNDYFCFISNDKNQCLFNLAIDNSLKYNDLKYCEKLYSQWNLDVNYVPWPNSEVLDGPTGKWAGLSLYPNKCMQVFHQWFYVTQRNKMFNLGLQDEIKIGQEACKVIDTVDGYDSKYPYNSKNCLDELRANVYYDIVLYNRGNCDDLKKIEGYNDSIYSLENCLNKVDDPTEKKEVGIRELTQRELADWYECIKPIEAAREKEEAELCATQGTKYPNGGCGVPMEPSNAIRNKYDDLVKKECPIEDLVKSEYIKCRILAYDQASQRTTGGVAEEVAQQVENELKENLNKCEQFK